MTKNAPKTTAKFYVDALQTLWNIYTNEGVTHLTWEPELNELMYKISQFVRKRNYVKY